MIKNVIQDIGGVGLYGIISLCLFFSVFAGALLWACLHNRSFCATMSALPLQDETTASKGGDSHD
jgi:hypothetical protein